MIELSWTVDPGAGGLDRLDGLSFDPFKSNAAGYGNMRAGICRALDTLGIVYAIVPAPSFLDRLVPAPLKMKEEYVDRPHPGGTRWRRICRVTDVQKTPAPDPVTRPDVTRICIGTPETWTWDGAGRRIGMTMWESSAVPDSRNSWVPWLQDADEVIVPCEHNAALVRRQAPGAAVRVVPLAVDGEDWPLMTRERKPGGSLTFLLAGQLSYRKGWLHAYQAFMMAFGRDPRFRLVLKTSSRSELVTLDSKDRSRYAYWFEDPNVMVLRDFYEHAGMLEMYRMADVFVWPSLGEGFGLPPREAAMTGLPVISTDNTGLEDAARWAWRTVRSEEAAGVAAIFGPWGYCGQWAMIDIGDLAAAMVQVAQEYDQAVAWTRDVARSYLTRRTWLDVARDILAPVEAHQTREVLCA